MRMWPRTHLRHSYSTMAGFAENQGSRVFHLMMIVPAGFLLLLLSFISLGTLARINNRFTDLVDDSNYDGTCILFAKGKDYDGGKVIMDFTDGDQCNFAIAGGAILAAIAVALSVVLVVKAIMGTGVVSIFALVEVGISGFGSLWAFIVSVVITAGLNTTCKAYTDENPSYKSFPCCSYYIHAIDDDEDRLYFYEGLNASRITAWFAMALLLAITAVYTCILIMYCCTSQGTSQGSSKAFGDIATTSTGKDSKAI